MTVIQYFIRDEAANIVYIKTKLTQVDIDIIWNGIKIKLLLNIIIIELIIKF